MFYWPLTQQLVSPVGETVSYFEQQGESNRRDASKKSENKANGKKNVSSLRLHQYLTTIFRAELGLSEHGRKYSFFPKANLSAHRLCLAAQQKFSDSSSASSQHMHSNDNGTRNVRPKTPILQVTTTREADNRQLKDSICKAASRLGLFASENHSVALQIDSYCASGDDHESKNNVINDSVLNSLDLFEISDAAKLKLSYPATTIAWNGANQSALSRDDMNQGEDTNNAVKRRRMGHDSTQRVEMECQGDSSAVVIPPAMAQSEFTSSDFYKYYHA